MNINNMTTDGMANTAEKQAVHEKLRAVKHETFDFGRAHLVGIGGCGMSAIAWAMLMCGVEVTGSDAKTNDNCLQLCDAGAIIHIGHDANFVGYADVVVVSSAIPNSNPEIRAAKDRGIRILHRSEALAHFLRQRKSVLVTGTHGKTTTSAMLGITMAAAGLDPWTFVGGRVPAFNGNTRVGGVEWAVAEADESDGSFEKLPADHLILTNIESDHLDYWKSAEHMMDGYRRVIENASPDGIILSCLDDAGAEELRKSVKRDILTYSLRGGLGHYSANNIELGSYWSRFDLCKGDETIGKFELGVPGVHNVSNAVGILAMTAELGGDVKQTTAALKEFRGVGRRFEIKGTVNDITVVDDYAHHPTEIRATIAASRMIRQENEGRLVAVFQPHRYTRTRDLMDEFADCFAEADFLVLTDIYSAGEDAIDGINVNTFAAKVENAGAVPVQVIRDRSDIATSLAPQLQPGDVVLTLGAGDNTRTGKELLQTLAQLFPHEGENNARSK